MDLSAVADELADRLAAITGLRVHGYPTGTVVPPAAVIAYPEAVDYDATYGRGLDRIPSWPVTLVVGKASDRTARDRIYEYAAGSGDKSIKATLESGTYTSLDSVTVVRCEFDVVTIASIDYIAATFVLDVVGQGSA